MTWLLHQPGVAALIVGAKKMSQLNDNLGSVDIKLSDEELEKIAETTKPKPIYPQWMVDRQNGEN